MEIKELKEIIAYLELNPQIYDSKIGILLRSLEIDIDYMEHYLAIENKDINTLNIEELKTMYTYILRGERFCRGHIVSYILDGTMLKLAKRHLELIDK